MPKKTRKVPKLSSWELAELHRLADNCSNTHAVKLISDKDVPYFMAAHSYNDALMLREDNCPPAAKPSDFTIFSLLDYWEG